MNLKLFDGKTPTWVFTALEKNRRQILFTTNWISIRIFCHKYYKYYNRNKLQSLLVEGGSQLLQSFIDEEIWDEIYIEYSEALLHKGVKHPIVPAGYGKQVLSRDENTIIHYEK